MLLEEEPRVRRKRGVSSVRKTLGGRKAGERRLIVVTWHDEKYNCYSVDIAGMNGEVHWDYQGEVSGFVGSFGGVNVRGKYPRLVQAQRAVEAYAKALAKGILKELSEKPPRTKGKP